MPVSIEQFLVHVEHIEQNRVTSLNLNDCIVLYEEFDLLCAAIQNNTSLRELQLTNCEIDDACMYMLCVALKVNTTLTRIDLSFNKIREDGLYSLYDLFAKNKTLAYVDLSKNLFNDAAMDNLIARQPRISFLSTNSYFADISDNCSENDDSEDELTDLNLVSYFDTDSDEDEILEGLDGLFLGPKPRPPRF
jgi:Leucine-rich repeat (LRR) protein